MTGALIGRYTGTQTQKGESHVTTEAGVSMMQPQDKEGRGLPEAGRHKEGFPLEPLEGAWPCLHFYCRTVICYGSAGKPIHLGTGCLTEADRTLKKE